MLSHTRPLKQVDSEAQQTSLVNKFYSAIGARLLNEQAPKEGLHKEVQDAVMAILFPDVLNNPISRKRNLEFIIFILMEACKEHIFLELLFTQHQLKLLADSLAAYKSALGREAASCQHRYLDLIGNKPKNLAFQRIAVLQEMLHIQSSMYDLRRKTKEIYAVMGKEFKQIFNAKAAHLLDPNPKHVIAIAVPMGGKIEVEQNGLVCHVRDHVSGIITKFATPPADFERTVWLEVGRGTLNYVLQERPEVTNHFNDANDILELAPLLNRMKQIIGQFYLLDDRIRNLYSHTVKLNTLYREQEARLQQLTEHPSLSLDGAMLFGPNQFSSGIDEVQRPGLVF